MPTETATSAGPFMPIAIAAKLLKGTERDVEALVAAGLVDAKGLEESGDRQINSGHLIFHIREKRARAIERKLTGREPYLPPVATACWFDDRGREIDPRARSTYMEPPLMLDVIGPGVSAFCLDCPEGPDGRPCEGCPAPSAGASRFRTPRSQAPALTFRRPLQQKAK